jgi:D-alanine--poly(phosphoribitol) ligase subunit 1
LPTPDVLSVVLDHGATGPDRPAVKDLDQELTYLELRGAAAAVALGLSTRGVAEGDRVALHLPNSVDFVVAALACLWTGAIFVPLATTDPPARVAGILADCTPALVVTSDDSGDDPGDGDSKGKGPGTETPIDTTSWVPIGALRLPGAEPPAPSRSSERGAYAIYTSGTTGTPKGVLIGNRAFAAAVAATAEALGLNGETRTLCVSPFHFDGSFGTLFPTLYSGGAVVIRPREALLFPRTFFSAVKREGVNYTGFSPSYLQLLLSSPQMGQLADTGLGVVALGGEASSIADIRALWAAAPQVAVFNRYGPTETTIAVTHVRVTPESIAGGTVSMGRPHPGVTFHVVDEAGRVVEAANQVGELYIGGDQLMDGYWGAPALTDEVLRTDVVAGQTVYRTGDLVYRTDDGEYVYVDRADRVMKRHGVRISLVELGEALRGLDGVSAAACVAFDDGGQTGIVAFVVADGPVDALDLRRAAAHHLPESMLPDRFEVVDSLPLTRSSKLDERRLLAEAGLNELRSGAAPVGPTSS